MSLPHSLTKPCATCARVMSADDPHHRCQRCRHGGRWRSKGAATVTTLRGRWETTLGDWLRQRRIRG